MINDFTAQALAIPLLRADEREQIGSGAPVAGAGDRRDRAGHRARRRRPAAGRRALAADPGRGRARLAGAARRRSRRRSCAACGGASATSPTSACCPAPGWSTSRRALAALEGVDARHRRPAAGRRARAAAASAASAARRWRRFSAMLGAAAGDLALTLGARGGIYIGGGLCQAAGRAVRPRRASARASSPRGGSATSSSPIPTYLVTRRDPGLLGAAASALVP